MNILNDKIKTMYLKYLEVRFGGAFISSIYNIGEWSSNIKNRMEQCHLRSLVLCRIIFIV